ncbi:MAG: hypothetical protein Q4F71_01430 [Paracoccus sp. (in: a-proteobacteria)]|nr:hypothetical protein [Paracoccus sp. (in: a-proteobacteria)]
MRLFSTILAASPLVGAGAAAAEPPAFPASELRAALAGEAFTAQGMDFPPDPSRAYAFGFITATAAAEAREGRWCDGHILPHELLEEVFTHIEALETPDETPADIAVTDALGPLNPCAADEAPQ